MSKQRLQIINDTETSRITAFWLKDTETSRGRQKFLHSDCEIFLFGRDNDRVANVIMNALQDVHMSSRKLFRQKGRLG